jgi:outer membrane protein
LLQTPIAIYDKAKEQRTELKLAQINLEIAEKNVAIAKRAFQPTLRGFYNLSTRVGYADRIVGTELDALNPTSVFGFVENKPKCFAS